MGTNQDFKCFDLGFDDFSMDEPAKTKKSASINQKVVDERALKRFVKNEEIHFLAARHLDDLCARPKPGEQYRIVTEKSFNAYAFICSLLEEGQVDDLHLAIYRINEPTVRYLCGMISDGRIQKATFIISSFFNQTKKPEVWAERLAGFCKAHGEKCKFAYLHNHSKVCCLKNKKGFYVFEGSGNMSDNARIEQYTYENNKDVYDFHCEWMDRLILETEKSSDKI